MNTAFFDVDKEMEWYCMDVMPKQAAPKPAAPPRANSKTVVCIHPQTGAEVARYHSIAMAAQCAGVDRKNIKMALRGRHKTAGKYKWQFA